jgi:hypothetical protein
MARPHIEFVQVQALPWRRGLYGGARPDVDVKMLSLDADSGASTAIVRYPAGWARTTEEYLCADEEFFVLDGELTINGIGYAGMHYGYLPAGHRRRTAVSVRGAVLLTFFESEPKRGSGGERFRTDGGLVEHLDTNIQTWKPVSHDPKVPVGLMTKT